MNAPRDPVDKSFYRTAVTLITANPMKDGGGADEFSLRALRFVTRVNPHHPQPYVGTDSAVTRGRWRLSGVGKSGLNELPFKRKVVHDE